MSNLTNICVPLLGLGWSEIVTSEIVTSEIVTSEIVTLSLSFRFPDLASV